MSSDKFDAIDDELVKVLDSARQSLKSALSSNGGIFSSLFLSHGNKMLFF